jgi:FtsZ-binding cell division protein ZapB
MMARMAPRLNRLLARAKRAALRRPLDSGNAAGAAANALSSTADPAAHSARLDELTLANNVLTAQVNELTHLNNLLVGQVNELTGARNDLTGANNQLTADNNLLVARVNELTGRNNELTADVGRFTADVSRLTADNSLLVGKANEATGLNNMLTGRVNSLTADNNDLVAQQNALTGAQHSLIEQNSRLTAVNNSLVARVNELTGSINSLTERLNKVTGQNNRAAATLNALTALNSELTGRNNELTSRNNELTGRNNELTGENNALVGRKHQLEADFAQFSRIAQGVATGSLPYFRKDDTETAHPTLVDAALTVDEALDQALRLRTVNQRLADGFYRDKLVILSCLEKSGSTTLEICVRDMLEKTAGVKLDVGVQKTLEYGPFSFVGQLYPEILLYAPSGGVLRGVLQPRVFNVTLLNMWRCKHLILFRHPADRLVARYCDPTPGPLVTSDKRAWRREPQYPIPDIFDSGMSADEAIRELIINGYLLDTLVWMAEWLRVRDQALSMVVQYEDMHADAAAYFSRIHEFLFGAGPKAELSALLDDRVARYQTELQPGDASTRRYPHGYSGAVGVWRRYFSAANVSLYNHVVGNFLQTHPHAALLRSHCPDLLLPGS